MTITLDKTVWEIARELPASIKVFEELGMDYHGRRRKTLKQVCAELNLSGPQVLQELEKARAESLQEMAKPGAKANHAPALGYKPQSEGTANFSSLSCLKYRTIP